MVEPKARPGFGLSARISAIISARSSSSDAANLAKRGEIALGEQIETADQRLHGRIETVALLELDGEALGEIARADARRIEALHDGKHRLDLRQRRAELFGHGSRDRL